MEDMKTLIDQALEKMERSSQDKLEWDKQKHRLRVEFWKRFILKARIVLSIVLIMAGANLFLWVLSGILYFQASYPHGDFDSRWALLAWRPAWFAIQASVTGIILGLMISTEDFFR